MILDSDFLVSNFFKFSFIRAEPLSPSEENVNSNEGSRESDASDTQNEGISSVVQLPDPDPWPDHIIDPRTSIQPLSASKKDKHLNFPNVGI